MSTASSTDRGCNSHTVCVLLSPTYLASAKFSICCLVLISLLPASRLDFPNVSVPHAVMYTPSPCLYFARSCGQPNAATKAAAVSGLGTHTRCLWNALVVSRILARLSLSTPAMAATMLTPTVRHPLSRLLVILPHRSSRTLFRHGLEPLSSHPPPPTYASASGCTLRLTRTALHPSRLALPDQAERDLVFYICSDVAT